MATTDGVWDVAAISDGVADRRFSPSADRQLSDGNLKIAAAVSAGVVTAVVDTFISIESSRPNFRKRSFGRDQGRPVSIAA